MNMGSDIINRILIVDGSNLLFQMFFDMPARIVNKQGKTYTHGNTTQDF